MSILFFLSVPFCLSSMDSSFEMKFEMRLLCFFRFGKRLIKIYNPVLVLSSCGEVGALGH